MCDGDIEAISVDEDTAPGPGVQGTDLREKEETFSQVVMGGLVNRNSALTLEPVHRDWAVRATERAVQNDPIRRPEGS